MNERKLDRLFLRYRRKGDAAALGEVFDRAAPELLKLAMHLVRDAQEAEDVLQATFLAAIEGADSFDASRRLVPWLTGILARQAGLARRRARRVIEEDRLTARVSEDPFETAALKEFSQELVLALQALPENYREVLWLHLADGKRPAEIAQALQRAPGTVRMQVHRGLDLLRRALPTGFAAMGGGELGAIRGLEAIRADVLARALASSTQTPWAGPAPAQAVSTTAWTLGSSGLIPWALAVLALVSLATAAWWQLRDKSSFEVASLRSPALSEPDVGARRPAQAEPASNARAEPNIAGSRTENASAQPILLRGRVTGLGDGQWSETQLSVHGIARFPLPADLVVQGTPAADGSFELDVSRLFQAEKPKRPLDELLLEAEHSHYVHGVVHVPLFAGLAAANRGEPQQRIYTTDVELKPAGLLSGRVISVGAAAGSRACILLFLLLNGQPLEPAEDRVLCETDGSFTLRARQAGLHAVVFLQSGMRPSTVSASPAPNRSFALGTIVLDEGAVIEGQAFHMDRPMRAGGLVSASSTPPGVWYAFERSRFLWNGQAFETPGATVETDQDGRFRISGLAPGPYTLGVARAAPLGAPASQRRLLLSTSAWTNVSAPVSGVEIRATFGTLHLQLRAHLGPSTPPLAPARVRLQQALNFSEFPLELATTSSVSVEPGVECQIHVEAEGYLTLDTRLAPPPAGEEATAELLLEADPALAQLVLELVPPSNEEQLSFREATFIFSPVGAGSPGAGEFVRRASSENGTFLLPGLPAGEWSVSAFAGSVYEHYHDLWCEAKSRVRLSAGTAASLSLALRRGGLLEISAQDAAGSLLPAACTIRTLNGESLAVEFMGRGLERSGKSTRLLSEISASAVRPILPAGRYEIELSVKGYEPARLFVDVETGKRAAVHATLQALER